MRAELIIYAVAAALAVAGCGPAHRGEPNGPRVTTVTPDQVRGERLFFQMCSQCHPGGGAGLGPAINNMTLPAIAIKTQIRKGVGAMPSFSDEELSDDDVDAVTDYVTHMMEAPATHAQADARKLPMRGPM